MRRRTLFAALALALAALAGAPRSGAEDAAAPVPAASGEVASEAAVSGQAASDEGFFFESVDVNVVNVEVFVTDKQGNPITGLTRDDFVVYEKYRGDERQVAISNFYAVEGGAPVGPDAPQVDAQPLVPGDDRSLPKLPEDQRLSVIVYVDNFNIRPFNRNRVFRRLREFLHDHVDRNARVMLVSYDRSLNVRHPFTSDSGLVASALYDLEKLTGFALHYDSDRNDVLREIADAESYYEVDWRVRQFAESVYNDLLFSIDAVKEMIETLGGLAGRKALIYVSDGIPMSPAEDLFQAIASKFGQTTAYATAHDYHAGRRFEQLATVANANRVVFYTIDAGGLRTPSAASVETSWAADSPGMSTLVDSTHFQNIQAPLRMLAERTGGQVILNTNDVGPGLDKIATDFETYYSLGYSPSHAGDGRYYRIRVELKDKRKGVRLRYREGYRDKNQYARMSEATTAGLMYGFYSNPLDVALEVGSGKPAEKSGQYEVQVMVEIPMSKIVLVPRSEFYQGRVKLFFSAMDEKGDMSDVSEVPLDIRIANADIERAKGLPYRYGAVLRMRSGGHRLAVGVRDELGAIESFVVRSVQVGS